MTSMNPDKITNLLQLAEKHGLKLDAHTININESGMDFLVGFANDESGKAWVLRVPRREDVLERAGYEGDVLALVSRHLPIAVPQWRIHTAELIAYPMLEGTPAGTIDPEARQYVWHINPEALKPAFIESLAQSLAAVHSIDHQEAAARGIRVLSPEEVRTSLIKRMQEIKQKIGVSNELWQRWQAWTGDDSYWPQHSALIHGDMHAGHILVDAEERVSGFIDWTEGQVGDPAADFKLCLATFGEDVLAEVIAQYEAAGGRVWPRMRDHIIELWAAYAVDVAAFALLTGDEATLDMARSLLGVNDQEQSES
ncbi:macrolide 2'-phosphotransferase [Paenibacillus sp. ACRRX]|uniref:macrolide 2'-phosphotransferase n=1 Tax=Paenibacillus sp. ACRRX TaxID=2918206 RepID=UPI001EF63CD9|nr:macrolide 2'-phosphotransferase [Paenibacillus sp. ACRRX]MCG7409188.1 macrolide 2'-phosphotransferase [Paenibacillus sp. ACRRX]